MRLPTRPDTAAVSTRRIAEAAGSFSWHAQMGHCAQLDEDAVDARGREVPLEQTPVGQRPVRQRQIRQRDLGDCPLGEVRPLQLWEVEAEQVEEEEEVWHRRPRRQVRELGVVLAQPQPRQRQCAKRNMRQVGPRQMREAGAQLAKEVRDVDVR